MLFDDLACLTSVKEGECDDGAFDDFVAHVVTH